MLGIKHLIIKGESQLPVNFSNKSYMPKHSYMMAYLEEVRRLEKHFIKDMELMHIKEGEP